MIRPIGPINSGAAAGSSGSALSNYSTDQVISGRLLAAYVKYNDSPPNTTDVVIKTLGTESGSPPSTTLLTLTNKNTSGWFYPRVTPDDQLGVDLTTLTVLEPVPFVGKIDVSIAGADEADNVDVWLLVED
jgi:hypothetical protein